ncbi:hypothetical protein GVAV_000990 [Gurleya vavrai]
MQHIFHPINKDLIYENKHNSEHSKIQEMNRILYYIDNLDINKFEAKKENKSLTMNSHDKIKKISDGKERINRQNENQGSENVRKNNKRIGIEKYVNTGSEKEESKIEVTQFEKSKNDSKSIKKQNIHIATKYKRDLNKEVGNNPNSFDNKDISNNENFNKDIENVYKNTTLITKSATIVNDEFEKKPQLLDDITSIEVDDSDHDDRLVKETLKNLIKEGNILKKAHVELFFKEIAIEESFVDDFCLSRLALDKEINLSKRASVFNSLEDYEFSENLLSKEYEYQSNFQRNELNIKYMEKRDILKNDFKKRCNQKHSLMFEYIQNYILYEKYIKDRIFFFKEFEDSWSIDRANIKSEFKHLYFENSFDNTGFKTESASNAEFLSINCSYLRRQMLYSLQDQYFNERCFLEKYLKEHLFVKHPKLYVSENFYDDYEIYIDFKVLPNNFADKSYYTYKLDKQILENENNTDFETFPGTLLNNSNIFLTITDDKKEEEKNNKNSIDKNDKDPVTLASMENFAFGSSENTKKNIMNIYNLLLIPILTISNYLSRFNN